MTAVFLNDRVILSRTIIITPRKNTSSQMPGVKPKTACAKMIVADEGTDTDLAEGHLEHAREEQEHAQAGHDERDDGQLELGDGHGRQLLGDQR